MHARVHQRCADSGDACMQDLVRKGHVRDALKGIYGPCIQNGCVFIMGSFAREEECRKSDVEFGILVPDTGAIKLQDLPAKKAVEEVSTFSRFHLTRLTIHGALQQAWHRTMAPWMKFSACLRGAIPVVTAVMPSMRTCSPIRSPLWVMPRCLTSCASGAIVTCQRRHPQASKSHPFCVPLEIWNSAR